MQSNTIFLHFSVYKIPSTIFQSIIPCEAFNVEQEISKYLLRIKLQKPITDLSVIFNPVGDDLFNPLRTAPIHPFPSLLASASWKAAYIKTVAKQRHGHAALWWTCPMECAKEKRNTYKWFYYLCHTILGKALINYWLPEKSSKLIVSDIMQLIIFWVQLAIAIVCHRCQ